MIICLWRLPHGWNHKQNDLERVYEPGIKESDRAISSMWLEIARYRRHYRARVPTPAPRTLARIMILCARFLGLNLSHPLPHQSYRCSHNDLFRHYSAPSVCWRPLNRSQCACLALSTGDKEYTQPSRHLCCPHLVSIRWSHRYGAWLLGSMYPTDPRGTVGATSAPHCSTDTTITTDELMRTYGGRIANCLNDIDKKWFKRI